jgi:hypothetical protein
LDACSSVFSSVRPWIFHMPILRLLLKELVLAFLYWNSRKKMTVKLKG